MNTHGKHHAPCLTSQCTWSTSDGSSLQVPGREGQTCMTLEQLAELARKLRLPVEVGETPASIEGVELLFALGRLRTIEPIKLRVAPDVTFDHVCGYQAVVGRVASYNRALRELRILRGGLGALVLPRQTPMEPGSEIWCAYQDLVRLERTIERRQTSRLSNGLVSLTTFYFEVEFWERYLANVAAAFAREADENRERTAGRLSSDE